LWKKLEGSFLKVGEAPYETDTRLSLRKIPICRGGSSQQLIRRKERITNAWIIQREITGRGSGEEAKETNLTLYQRWNPSATEGSALLKFRIGEDTKSAL